MLYHTVMDTFSTLIDRAGPRAELAQVLGVKVRAVGQMRSRNWIEPRYWRRLRAYLAVRGVVVEAQTLELWAEQRG